MIQDAKDMYDALLLAINKEETSTVYPNQAIWLLNEGAILWLKENSKLVELNQREIDDLQDLRETLHEQNPTGTDAYGNKYYDLNLPVDPHKYFQLLNVSARISDTDICVDTAEYQRLYVLRSDQRNAIYNSPYRKPRATKLYYDLKSGLLTVYGGTVTKFHIEYLAYIKEILDVTTTPTPMTNYSPYILQEVVDVAARIYLERTENPRYMTTLKELAIKAQGE